VSAIAARSRQLETLVAERTEALQVAREKAEVANRAKNTFLVSMSHELRTPLNAVLGFAQLMERDPSVLATHGEHLGMIRRSGEHLLELINDVLELSRIEAGGTALNAGSFDLHHTLDEVEEMVRFRAENKGLQLAFERAPDAPRYVKTDERKLRQVLTNLLDNGFKFTEQGGVTLRVGSKEEQASTADPNLQPPL
jgi:signal transduction histidine kinase